MGCGGSKVDDLPLVKLCKERKDFLKAASDHRYAFAAAHISYFRSLKDVGDALRKFVDEELVIGLEDSPPDSPVLTLPSEEGKSKKNHHHHHHQTGGGGSSSSTSISHSHVEEKEDGEGSHLHLSGSDVSDSDDSGHGHIHHDIGTEEEEHVAYRPNYRHRSGMMMNDSTYDNVPTVMMNDSNYDNNVPAVNPNNYWFNPPWAPQAANDSNYGSYGAPWTAPDTNNINYNSYNAPYNVPDMNSATYNSYTTPWNGPGVNNSNYTSNAYYMRRTATRPSIIYEDPREYSANMQWQGPLDASSRPNLDNNRRKSLPVETSPPPAPPSPANYTLNAYYMRRNATRPSIIYEDPREYSANVQWQGPSDASSRFNLDNNRRQSPPEETAPPPAPPSPGVSGWDFLNIFNTYNEASNIYYSRARYGYGSTTSSPDSKEVREREGIPDLEDETESDVIKEALKRKGKKLKEGMNNDRPSNPVPSQHGEGSSRSVPFQNNEFTSKSTPEHDDEVTHESSNEQDAKSSPESMETKNSEEYPRKKAVSFEVDEASMMDNGSSKLSSLTTLSAYNGGGTRDLKDAVMEIKTEFDAASSLGKEVSMLLEVGRLPYQSKGTALRVIFSSVMYSITPSRSSRSSVLPQPGQALRLARNTRKLANSFYGEPGEDINVKPSNLSLTLEKLYMWEKKLYKEVKDEERLRVIYERKCKRLKLLDNQGAESNKIEATQTSTKKLLARLHVNIRSIDAISSRIHKLRDEELQPQLADLIHGLVRMWKSVLKCHQKQLQAIVESKTRALRANTGIRGESSLRATVELEMELLKWSTRFNTWIKSQKSYVKCLNEWLLRCIVHEPEITPDGVIPFSPSRIGAPPAFIICNDWFEALYRISESAVSDAMSDFALILHQLWEKQDEEQRQRIKSEYLLKDFEKHLGTYGVEKVKQNHKKDEKVAAGPLVNSDSGVSPLDDLKVDLDSMRKKLEEERARHKEAVKLVHNAASSSIQAGLIPIFESLGKFTADALKAHEQVRTNNGTGVS